MSHPPPRNRLRRGLIQIAIAASFIAIVPSPALPGPGAHGPNGSGTHDWDLAA
jgi:hypothetical protein